MAHYCKYMNWKIEGEDGRLYFCMGFNEDSTRCTEHETSCPIYKEKEEQNDER